MSNSTAQSKADPSEEPQQQKPQVLEEDDEFEDFPVEGRRSSPWICLQILKERTILIFDTDWPQEETEASNGSNEHLWEESWDDDDAAEDFSKQLQ